MREAVIVDAVRTPLGRGKKTGALAGWHPVDLAAEPLKAVVDRTGIDPALIEDVIMGCVSQVGDQSLNVARNAALAAGFPDSVPGTSVDRQCGSSQQALDFAVHAVMSGQQDVVVAGGVESMSRVPLGAARADGMPYGPRALARYDNFQFNQGIGAEMIAEKWGFSRTRLDELSAQSHEWAAAAIDRGAFDAQIVPVETADGTVARDEGLRRGTTVEKLAGLKPVFKEDGVIHAGNSSQIADGAAALLVTTPEKARELGLAPIVRYRAGVVAKASSTPQRVATTSPVASGSTLAGIVNHLALVEDDWFDHRFAGNPEREPWASAPWDVDRDWEFHVANEQPLEEVIARYEAACARSRQATEGRQLDDVAAAAHPGREFNLRFVITHLIEETARHLGHMDILRELLDGTTGE